MRSRGLLLCLVLVGLLGGSVAWTYVARQPMRDNPWRSIRKTVAHTDHTPLIRGPFADGPSVTRACLKCHPNAAHEVMATAHWTWLGPEVQVPGHEKPLPIGKKNLINNFCIGVEPNLPGCTTCHAGYGWTDASFDFSNANNVDCLICHETTGTYKKAPGTGGLPAAGIDLLAVAQSVGRPTRRNCGSCHFAGGGADAVKHGDLDGTMYHPTPRIDAHMGKHNLTCTDCHRTQQHAIPGRSMSVSIDPHNRIACTDCHASAPHKEDRLNSHTRTLACQTCHIPEMAVEAPTKMSWDWSTAGQDRPETHDYAKKKGTFVYAKNIKPEYYWYNGQAERYLLGDKIDPTKITHLNYPLGSIDDPAARIWPFKVHRGQQIYDTVNRYFIVPQTFGKGGYWDLFDWDKAARLGAEATGLPYSGQYGFAPTDMYWPLSHMVSTKDKALQCTDCHTPNGRMDWNALGYPGDPAVHGGRPAMQRMFAKQESRP